LRRSQRPGECSRQRGVEYRAIHIRPLCKQREVLRPRRDHGAGLGADRRHPAMFRRLSLPHTMAAAVKSSLTCGSATCRAASGNAPPWALQWPPRGVSSDTQRAPRHHYGKLLWAKAAGRRFPRLRAILRATNPELPTSDSPGPPLAS
jgi:hypothetical protein